MQDLEDSCPIWNTRSPPGCRKFDEPGNRVEMTCLKNVVIIINFNSATSFQEQSTRKILHVSSPFIIIFHVAEESEPGIWGMLSFCGP